VYDGDGKKNTETNALLCCLFEKSQVKSSHIYLYSAFHNTDCIKAASQ